MANTLEVLKEFPELDPKFFLQAVAIVLERYEDEGQEPRSERWREYAKHRQRIYKDVVKEWAGASGLDDACFAWTEDAVIHAWTRYGKKDPDQKRAFCGWIGVDMGFVNLSRVKGQHPKRRRQ